MHGARLMGYPVYYMSRAPAAPDIGTQHLEIPESIIPVDAWDERLMTPWIIGIERAQGWAYVRTHVVPAAHSLMHPGICTRVEGSLSATR
jgi:hypothetical protein